MGSIEEGDVPEKDCKQNSIGSDSEHESPTLETVSGFSSCSSPLPQEPFEPLYTVKFTGPVEKDGDVVKYTMKTKRKSDGTDFIVQRQYEDFEWLDHCLVTSNPLPGLIFPPLPLKPPNTSEMAEAKSKKTLGSDTKTVMGDQFNKDCLQLEQYLELLLSHRLFGSDEAMEAFLTEREPPIRAKIRKGLFTRISDSFSGKNNAHKDCEEFFQKERDWVIKYGSQTKETSEAFNTVVFAQQRVSAVLGHLATAFVLSQGAGDPLAKTGTKLCSLFSEALEISRHGLEILSYNDENTIGAYLDLYARYIECEKDMLYRRTCLLIDYENANKYLDKAKPQKKEAAEEAKLAAEKAFDDCSDIARQEIKQFHRLRVKMFQEKLEKFAGAQLRTARDVSAMLAKSLTALKQFQVLPETKE